MAFTSGALLALASAAACRPGHAAEHTIDMFREAFLPQSVIIELGDTVCWILQRGAHTVTSGRVDGEPGSPDEPGVLFDAEIDEANPTFSFEFNELRPNGYTFFCRNHPEQVGFIQISTGEISVRVAVVDNVFSPEEVRVFAGDSVRWEHEPMEDFHTVTSGLTSRPQDRPGELFDVDSSDADPIFVYAFTDPGNYPYFCRPHEFMGMRGKVLVQERFVRGDASGDNVVDFTDAVSMLNILFLAGAERCCQDALDANDDGAVDIGDPVYTLVFLFLGGARIPAPYPLAGGDRTEDDLWCCLPES